jgi:nitroreductase
MEIIKEIVLAGQRAPTACNMQYYSFILIDEERLRKKVYQLCHRQRSAKEAPVLLFICADINKIIKQADYKKLNHCFKHGYGLSEKFFAIFDACFAAQNIIIAAESFGLGSVMLGEPFDEVLKTVELLNLPSGVLPIIILCIGYPAEAPPLRPRWPLEAVLFKNSYREITEDEIKDYLDSDIIRTEVEKGTMTSLEELLDLEYHIDNEPKLKKSLKNLGFFDIV